MKRFGLLLLLFFASFSTAEAFTFDESIIASGGGLSLRDSSHVQIDANTIYVSYYDDNTQELRFASSTNGGTSWTDILVDDGGGDDVGLYNSMYAFDVNTIFISYTDQTNGDLKLAFSTNAGSTWTIVVADAGSDPGESSVHASSASNVMIAYYSGAIGELRFIESNNGGTTWQPFVSVDSGATEGITVHAVDSSTIYISYYEGVAADLHFADSTDGGGTFDVSVVEDFSTDTNSYAAMDVIDADNVVIAYNDTDNQNLRVAFSDDASSISPDWTIVEVEPTFSGEIEFPSVKALGLNKIYISYILSGEVKVAESVSRGFEWTTEVIDVADFGDDSTSLQIIDDDTVSVVYSDINVIELKYVEVTDLQSRWILDTTDFLPEILQGGGTVAYNNLLYHFGGQRDVAFAMPTDRVSIYDPSAGAGARWSEDVTDPMPAIRTHGTPVEVGGLIYYFGGRPGANPGPNVAQDNMYIYDPAGPNGGRWTTGTASGAPRHSYAAAAQGTIIYYAGGFDAGNTETNTILAYDTVGDSWNTGLTNMPVARKWLTGQIISGEFFTVGNESTDNLVYNIAGDSWSTAASYPFSVDLLSATSFLYNGELYISGGFDNNLGDPIYYTFVYDPVGDSWSVASALNITRNRGSGAVIGDTLYIIAGNDNDNSTFLDSLETLDLAVGGGGGATVPNAIVDLSATPGSMEVSLSWSAPADGGDPITDYVIQFGETAGFPGNAAVFNDGVSTATSATVTGLTNGTDYSFVVSAVNGIGTAADSNVETATPVAVGGGRDRASAIDGPQFFLGKIREMVDGLVADGDDEQEVLRGSAEGSGSGDFAGFRAPANDSVSSSLSDRLAISGNPELYPQFGGGGNAEVRSLLDLIRVLRILFAWTSHSSTELTPAYQVMADEYHRMFLTRRFHALVGVEYLHRGNTQAYEFDYVFPIDDPVENVVFLMRSVLLTFGKACYDDAVLRDAEALDVEGDQFWYRGYVRVMKPWMDEVLKTHSYVMWRSVSDVQLLDALWLYLSAFCLRPSIL